MFCLGLKRLYGAIPVQEDLMKLLQNTLIVYKGVSNNNIYTFELFDGSAGGNQPTGSKRRHGASSSGSSSHSKHHKRSL